MNPNDIKMTREEWLLHEEWLDRRKERDLQAAIKLQNMATFYLFRITDGVK